MRDRARMPIQAGLQCLHPFQQLGQREADHVRQGGMVQVGCIRTWRGMRRT